MQQCFLEPPCPNPRTHSSFSIFKSSELQLAAALLACKVTLGREGGQKCDNSLPSLYRFLMTGPVSSLLPDPECSFTGSPSSASGSPGPFSTSLCHRRLATADALSVHEPSHRLSCSRRLILAESPMIYPRRDAFLKIKHSVAKEDTPSMCTLALPGSSRRRLYGWLSA